MPECYLRKTEVQLLDGKKYFFRALPFTESTVAFMEKATGSQAKDASFLRALRESVRLSLSYDNGPEAVEELFYSGAIPFLPGEEGDPETEVYNEILGAMILQLKKGN